MSISRSPRGCPGDDRLQEAVIYARVSSKDQEKEGYSIPAQLELLRQYAERHGFRILREFIDVETAKAAGRVGFSEMVAFLGTTIGCRTILVEKTDRLYRNLRDRVTIDDLGAELHFVKENVVLSKDSRSHEKFIHDIKVVIAKNYCDNLSEETRKGMLEKAREGMWPSYAPLGYLNVSGPDGKRCIEPDPELAPMILQMYEMYATGRHSVLHQPVDRAALHLRGTGLERTSPGSRASDSTRGHSTSAATTSSSAHRRPGPTSPARVPAA
jgi:DNA invertase Pin-like site-specific DNA recombinase